MEERRDFTVTAKKTRGAVGGWTRGKKGKKGGGKGKKMLRDSVIAAGPPRFPTKRKRRGPGGALPPKKEKTGGAG